LKPLLDISTAVTPGEPAQEASTPSPLKLCPAAIATFAYDIEQYNQHLFALGCRKWSCDVCGPRKRFLLIKRITLAAPTKFITLTCRHEHGPEKQLDVITKALPKLITKIRKEHGDIEYLRALEYCKDGYPHYHLLARCKFIPNQWLSDTWKQHTQAYVTHIAKAHGRSTKYIAKYMSKATATENTWTRQQFAVSRNFWIKDERFTQWLNWSTRRIPAFEEARNITETNTLTRVAVGCYRIDDGREPGDEIPYELLPQWLEEIDHEIRSNDDTQPF
jgi:hypothetical protein